MIDTERKALDALKEAEGAIDAMRKSYPVGVKPATVQVETTRAIVYALINVANAIREAPDRA